MRILLLVFTFLLAGCGPAYHYNAKLKKLDSIHNHLQTTAELSEKEKDLLYLDAVESEFPDYFEEIYYLRKMVREIYAKQDRGENIEEDTERFGITMKKFWKIVSDDVSRRENAFSGALLQGMKDMRNEQNVNRLNCTTQYIGSSAYTNCY